MGFLYKIWRYKLYSCSWVSSTEMWWLFRFKLIQFHLFKSGNENLEDEPHIARPIDCSDVQIRYILENLHSTSLEIDVMLNVGTLT